MAVSYLDRFLAALDHAATLQRDLLYRCITANQDTEFGRAHRFGRIRDLDAFKRRIPIRDYAAYRPWLDRLTTASPGVLTAEAPAVFLNSSGTTSAPKRLPGTRTFLAESYLPFVAAAEERLRRADPSFLEDDAVLNFRFDVRAGAESNATGGLSQVDFGRLLPEAPPTGLGQKAPWAMLPASIDRHVDRLYCRLRLAAEHDVRLIIGVNPAILAAVPALLARFGPLIADEIRAGTMLGAPARPPAPARADQLDALLRRHGALAPHEVWPRLRMLHGWTTGVASLYIDDVRAAFGPDVVLTSAALGATEAPISLPVDDHPTAGLLTISSAYYEFAPAEDELSADSPTLAYDQLAPDRAYHVIATQCGGLYRYAIGDVVRVLEYVRGVPRVEYAGRRAAAVVAGARVPEVEILAAFRDTVRARGLRVQNFTSIVVDTRCVLVVDPVERWPADVESQVIDDFDDRLGARVPAYRRARQHAAAARPALHLVEPGGFMRRWIDRVERGERPAQVKDRIYTADPASLGLVDQP
ncbi:MAG TPA: GH3 auxin-responsive promoter family protein [Kofleriaceae bacterium]|nr:GH3 auxin-responsive promoter family protein [Kofleriaceae bacterium]